MYLSHPTLCPCLVFTANGLSSAAFAGSRLNSVFTYNPRNLTMVFGKPLPCEKAAGLAIRARKSTEGAFTVLVPPLVLPEFAPSACPFPENEAEDFAGPRAALAAAERTAVRSAVGLAPRTVSTTELPFRMRKVGMLWHVSYPLPQAHL